MNMNGLKFRVGAADYHTVEVSGLYGKYELFGQVRFDACEIEIDDSLDPVRKLNVLIHELLHAALFEAGYDEQDEEQVRRLGNVLTQVLRDNDFGFMRDEDCEAVPEENEDRIKRALEELY